MNYFHLKYKKKSKRSSEKVLFKTMKAKIRAKIQNNN